jgi:hypothetical protein
LKVPTELKSTGPSAALVGAMLPVSNTPASVAVWANVSEFNQFTDWPTFTITGLGEYTPLLIVTVSRLHGLVPSGFVGEIPQVEELVEGLVELLQPPATRAKTATATSVPRVTMTDRLNNMTAE